MFRRDPADRGGTSKNRLLGQIWGALVRAQIRRIQLRAGHGRPPYSTSCRELPPDAPKAWAHNPREGRAESRSEVGRASMPERHVARGSLDVEGRCRSGTLKIGRHRRRWGRCSSRSGVPERPFRSELLGAPPSLRTPDRSQATPSDRPSPGAPSA